MRSVKDCAVLSLADLNTKHDVKKRAVFVKSDSILVTNAQEDPATPTNLAELSKIYKIYVTYEAILINVLGFFTLFFQCQLQSLEDLFLENHPDMPQWEADSLFGHYWLKGKLNCSTEQARCLTYMVAGWLMIAAILQVFINFDGLRRRVFATDWDCPRGIKIICLYSYFVCDWYWVVLMYRYSDIVGYQQIVGSAFDILLRLYFVFDTKRCFKNNP